MISEIDQGSWLPTWIFSGGRASQLQVVHHHCSGVYQNVSLPNISIGPHELSISRALSVYYRLWQIFHTVNLLFWSIQHTWRQQHVCLSWKIDPSSVVPSEIFSSFNPVKGFFLL